VRLRLIGKAPASVAAATQDQDTREGGVKRDQTEEREKTEKRERPKRAGQAPLLLMGDVGPDSSGERPVLLGWLAP
jgi:hypothetical protein